MGEAGSAKKPLRLSGVLAMGDMPVRLYGLDVPDWLEAVVNREGSNYSVGIRIEPNPELERPVPTGVRIIGNLGEPRTFRDAIDFLKGQPLDDLLHQAVLMAAGAWAWRSEKQRLGIPDDRTLSQEEAHRLAAGIERISPQVEAVSQTPPRRRTLTPVVLREVAQVHSEAAEKGHPPTRAVEQHFSISHRTATRWITAARDGGYLGSQRDGTEAEPAG